MSAKAKVYRFTATITIDSDEDDVGLTAEWIQGVIEDALVINGGVEGAIVVVAT